MRARGSSTMRSWLTPPSHTASSEHLPLLRGMLPATLGALAGWLVRPAAKQPLRFPLMSDLLSASASVFLQMPVARSRATHERMQPLRSPPQPVPRGHGGQRHTTRVGRPHGRVCGGLRSR